MVVYGIKYNGKIYHSIIYDVWDIEDKKHSVVGRIHKVTRDDVGKYLKLNDGSKQYVKILKIYRGRIDTSGGLYYKNETICMVNPRIPGMEYSGVKKGEEHLEVVLPTDEEKKAAYELAHTGKTDYTVTKRVKYMSQAEMSDYVNSKGYDATSVLDRTIDLAFGRTNQHTVNALRAIDKVLGMNIYNVEKEKTNNDSLMAMLGVKDLKQLTIEEADYEEMPPSTD